MDQQFACPHCTRAVSVAASFSGQMLACPYCSGKFSVPRFSAAEPAAPQIKQPEAPQIKKKPVGSARRTKKTEDGVLAKLKQPYVLAGAVLLGAFFVPLSIYVVVLMAGALFRTPDAGHEPVEVASAVGAAEQQPAPTETARATPAVPLANNNVGQPVATPNVAPISQPANVVPGQVTPMFPATQPVAVQPQLTQPPVAPPAAFQPPGAGLAAAPAAGNGSGIPGNTELEATRLVDQVEPSVVIIDIGTSLGSGFVYDMQGTIVTNYHVIEGAKKAEVKFTDKTSAEVTGFLAIAPGKDLALLRINPAGHALRPLRVAPTRPHKGESVLAFGAPRGLGSTVSDGIVSSLRQGTELRDVFKQMTGVDVYTEHQHYDLDAFWIQTTAPISGGNSGGPLVNLRGEGVGLNTWHRTDGQNLNFAISAEHIGRMMAGTQSGVQPLANLPPPREQPLAAGTPQRTLEYWEEVSRINRTLAGRIKKLRQPPIPDDPRMLVAMFPKISGTCKKLGEMLPEAAAKLKALKIDDVDQELVGLVTVDALTLEKIGENLRDLAVDVKLLKKVVAPLDTEILAKKAYGKYDDLELGAAYDVLRIKLTNRYGLTFASLLTDGPRTKPSKANEAVASADESQPADGGPSPADAEREKKASAKLQLAKQLGKTDAAKTRLQKIVDEFAGTKAADEAAKLLKEW
ncbi:MAG TPA: trypsin-like peptidase domain-containing protein [Pirellulales bacterium]|nr:trypsin-like peptidase domain-containing protein [Pirellulales bacterium]